MDAPVTLTPDDFSDRPEGFRSHTGKAHFTTLAATAGAVFFLLQMVLPQLVMFAMMPGQFMPGAMKFELPQVQNGIAWKGQLWVPFTQVGGPSPTVILRAATWDGEWVADSDLKLPHPVEGLVADGERLWCVAVGNVSLIDGRNITTTYPSRKLSGPSPPFLNEETLCLFDRNAQGNWQFLKFVDGEWTPDGWLQIPADAQGTAPAKGSVWRPDSEVQVATLGDDLWLVYSDGSSLWRTQGLPLTTIDPASASDAPASALEIVNRSTDPWERLPTERQFARASHSEWAVVGHGDGLTIVGLDSTADPNCHLDGLTWSVGGQVQPFERRTIVFLEHLRLIEPPDRGPQLLTETFPPGGVRVFDIEGRAFVEGMSLTGNSPLNPFSGKMWPMYLITWAIPVVLTLVFLVVMHVLIRAYRSERYRFGHAEVRLASLGRRAVARMIDTVLFSIPTFGVMAWAYLNYDLERLVEQFTTNFMQSLTTVIVIALAMMVYGLAVLIGLAVTEGVWGWSPGKLVCGIRVIRSTLRPLGFLRGLIRQLLLIVDGMFNYLIGVMLIAFLVKFQRLGDLAADAIVIEAATRPEPSEWAP